jgi:hypothetical protein
MSVGGVVVEPRCVQVRRRRRECSLYRHCPRAICLAPASVKTGSYPQVMVSSSRRVAVAVKMTYPKGKESGLKERRVQQTPQPTTSVIKIYANFPVKRRKQPTREMIFAKTAQ